MPMPMLSSFLHLTAWVCGSQGNMHVHDLVPFPTKDFDFSHTIHQLTFGQGYPGMRTRWTASRSLSRGHATPQGGPACSSTFCGCAQPTPDCICGAFPEVRNGCCRRTMLSLHC